MNFFGRIYLSDSTLGSPFSQTMWQGDEKKRGREKRSPMVWIKVETTREKSWKKNTTKRAWCLQHWWRMQIQTWIRINYAAYRFFTLKKYQHIKINSISQWFCHQDLETFTISFFVACVVTHDHWTMTSYVAVMILIRAYMHAVTSHVCSSSNKNIEGQSEI